MQKRIIYSSKSKKSFTDSDLEQLAQSSALKNESAGITGFLVYRNGFFLQYLEGEEEVLKVLLEKIHQDPRHSMLDEITLEKSEGKVFPEWKMESVSHTDLTGEISKTKKRFIVDCWAMLLAENLLWDNQ